MKGRSAFVPFVAELQFVLEQRAPSPIEMDDSSTPRTHATWGARKPIGHSADVAYFGGPTRSSAQPRTAFSFSRQMGGVGSVQE